MNKYREAQFVTKAVNRADEDSEVVEIQTIITVHIKEDLHKSSTQQYVIECKSESIDANECFEIIVLAENSEVGKAGFFRRVMGKLFGGWHLHFFSACNSPAKHYSMMLDRARKILLINIDLLRIPYRSLIKLTGKIQELISHALKAGGGLRGPKDSK